MSLRDPHSGREGKGGLQDFTPHADQGTVRTSKGSRRSADVAKKPSKSNVLPYTPKKPGASGTKSAASDTGVPRQDDAQIMALDLAPGQLSPAMQAYFSKC